MACQCNCCKGACCYDFAGTPQCSITSCEECEDLSGDWQGAGSSCTGDAYDECPCDPPADHTQCEKCVEGTPTNRCSEGTYCCESECRESPCGCVDIFDCPEGQVCCDGECMTFEEYETTCLGCCCADFEGDSECIGNFIAGQCNQDLGGPAFSICDSGECNFTFTPGACPEAPPP